MGQRRWKSILAAVAFNTSNSSSTPSSLRGRKGWKRFTRRSRKTKEMDTTFHNSNTSYTEIRDIDTTDGRVEMTKGTNICKNDNDNGNNYTNIDCGKDKRSRSDSTLSETTIATGKGSTRTTSQMTSESVHQADDIDNDNAMKVETSCDEGNIEDNRKHKEKCRSPKTDNDSAKIVKNESTPLPLSLSTTTLTPVVAKRRRVSFKVGFAETVIYEIPHQYNTEDLYYGDADYERFRANELKRYNKMVAKKLQKMVQEKIQPEINEAVANGATLEDIEAMVPKTQEEMVAYLGGEERIRGEVPAASSFGSQLNGKDEKGTTQKDSNKKRTIRSSRSSIEIMTAPPIKAANTTEKLSKNTVMNANGNGETNSNSKLGAIRSSRSSIKKKREGRDNANGSGDEATMSVLEAAAEATAAAADWIAQEEKEEAYAEEKELSSSSEPESAVTIEEIDAMVPRTHAEMVAYLGAKRMSLEQLDLSPPPNDKWTVPSSRLLVERASMPSDDGDDDAC